MESNVVCFLLQKMSNMVMNTKMYTFYLLSSTPLLKFQFALLAPTLETCFVCIQTYQVSQVSTSRHLSEDIQKIPSHQYL